MFRPFFLRGSLSRVLLCAFLASALAHSPAAEPRWIRVSSTHFSVLTDAGEKKGREVALRLEQMRDVFAQLLLKTRVNMSEPLDIIAVSSDEEYVRVAPMRQGQPISAPAFFLPGEDRDYIVLDLFADESWRAVAHECAHLLLNYNYPPTQSWFDEGFAEYFSSLRVSNDRKGAEIGGDPELSLPWKQSSAEDSTASASRSLTGLLSGSAWMSLPELFTTRHDAPGFQEGSHLALFYAQSWMVMHYLLNRNKLSETGTYFDLVQNQKLPLAQAIQQAYGMSAAQFERAVKDYYHSVAPQPATAGPSQGHRLASLVGPDDIGTSVHPVADAVAHALLAEMMLRLPEHREQATKDLDAIVGDPKTENAIAHRALAWANMERKEFEAAGAELGKAAELDGRDPWVHYYAGLLKYRAAQSSGGQFHGLANMIQDLRAVLDSNPEFAEAYNLLALARAEGGGVNAAMEAMRMAIQLSPRNEDYLLNLAQIYMTGKKWDSATALLQRLKSSANPRIAQAASNSLQDLPALKKYGILPQRSVTAPQAASPVPAAASSGKPSQVAVPSPDREDEASASHEQTMPAEPQPDKRAIQFLKGKLVSVDCTQAPAAILTVTSGAKTMQLRTGNYKSLLLIGADEFSCAWTNQPVTVNYKAAGKTNGDLVSLEVQ